jgi:uncharacterized protein
MSDGARPSLDGAMRTELLEVLARFAGLGSFFIFGSRARGSAGRFSDIDLLLDAPSPLALDVIAELEEAFSESELPIRVEVVEARRADPSFLAAISRDLRPIEPDAAG